MKHNLKNVPEVYCEAHDNPVLESCSKEDMEKLHKWFGGFEKELHEIIDACEKQPIQGENSRIYLMARSETLKEVLGETP